MVEITRIEKNIKIEVKGLHKLWSFKSEIIIPKEHILRVYQDKNELSGWKGWRMPGTSVPFLITAGTFHKSGDTIFWDVVHDDKAIIIELHDEHFKKLIVEVENPEETIALLKAN